MHDQAWKLRELVRACRPDDAEAAGTRAAGRQEQSPVPLAASPRDRALTGGQAQPVPGGPRVIAVCSGKGGVGKSHVAANLAYCVALAGRRTLLVDADLGMANLDLLLGLTPGRNLGHVITGQADLGAILMDGPGGLVFLPGASGLARAANLADRDRDGLLEELFRLEDSVDMIVLDTGAGISRNVTAFVAAADQAMVVTTPEPTAMTDAYGLIKVLVSIGFAGQIGVLVNQAADREEGRAVYTRLSRTAARFLDRAVCDFGFLPFDESVAQAVRARRLVVAGEPGARISRAFVALAARLLGDGRLVHRATAQGGLFRRIAGLFF